MHSISISHKLFIAGIVLSLASSCSNTKYLPENESLYTGSSVTVNNTPKLTVKEKKVLRSDLNNLTRPRPNSAILGLRIKLFAYNIAGKNPKRKGIRGWLKYKVGEPPVLLSSVDLEHNSKVLQNHLENNGFFQAVVPYDTVVKKKRARAVYKPNAGNQYTIKEVHFSTYDTIHVPIDSTVLQKYIAQTANKSLLKPGNPYNLEVIKAERLRIDAFLKENGFYFFHPEYILVDVDSTVGNTQVNLYVKVKPTLPDNAGKVYTINDIYIYSNYSLNSTAIDTNRSHAMFHKGYYVVDEKKFYKPKLFEQSMQFSQEDVYNRTDHNASITRLVNLGVFKFVKNRFEVVTADTFPRLNVYYYLTPMPKKSLRAEVGGLTKSNNMTGSEISAGFTNRNTFRGGEILSVKGSIGTEVQYSGQSKGYNSFRFGAEANLSIPQFYAPLFKIDHRGSFIPRTNIQLGFDFLTKQELYSLTSYKVQLGYKWKESILKEHELNPISIQYVQPFKVTDLYKSQINDNITLKKVIDTQFILGSNYTYNFNQLLGNRPTQGMYFNGNVDLSGNVAGLISGANAKKGKTKEILNAPFSQYFKLETDFRYYYPLGLGNVLANRIIIGIGIPYGNSKELPFIKQYFIGGNSSLRGFRSRSVGPGRYVPPPNRAGFLPDQSGDLKLELNSEYRAKLFSIVEGAVFVDAGNIWLLNEHPLKPGAKFTKEFLSELAVDAGVGLRFDITILILRLDLAFPLRRPVLPRGERWVINEIDVINRDWRKQNFVFNLAIGYPF